MQRHDTARVHSVASRTAAAAIATLAVLQLAATPAAEADVAYGATVLLLLAVASGLTALKLLRDNCFESRLAAVVLSALSGLGAALDATIGLPGHPGGPLTAEKLLAVAIGVVVPALVQLDARLRREHAPVVPPYAL